MLSVTDEELLKKVNNGESVASFQQPVQPAKQSFSYGNNENNIPDKVIAEEEEEKPQQLVENEDDIPESSNQIINSSNYGSLTQSNKEQIVQNAEGYNISESAKKKLSEEFPEETPKPSQESSRESSRFDYDDPTVFNKDSDPNVIIYTSNKEENTKPKVEITIPVSNEGNENKHLIEVIKNNDKLMKNHQQNQGEQIEENENIKNDYLITVANNYKNEIDEFKEENKQKIDNFKLFLTELISKSASEMQIGGKFNLLKILNKFVFKYDTTEILTLNKNDPQFKVINDLYIKVSIIINSYFVNIIKKNMNNIIQNVITDILIKYFFIYELHNLFDDAFTELLINRLNITTVKLETIKKEIDEFKSITNKFIYSPTDDKPKDMYQTILLHNENYLKHWADYKPIEKEVRSNCFQYSIKGKLGYANLTMNPNTTIITFKIESIKFIDVDKILLDNKEDNTNSITFDKDNSFYVDFDADKYNAETDIKTDESSFLLEYELDIYKIINIVYNYEFPTVENATDLPIAIVNKRFANFYFKEFDIELKNLERGLTENLLVPTDDGRYPVVYDIAKIKELFFHLKQPNKEFEEIEKKIKFLQSLIGSAQNQSESAYIKRYTDTDGVKKYKFEFPTGDDTVLEQNLSLYNKLKLLYMDLKMIMFRIQIYLYIKPPDQKILQKQNGGTRRNHNFKITKKNRLF